MRLVMLAGALLALAPAALAAAAPGAPTILVAPGGWLTQYATPAMATSHVLGLQLQNQDIMRHDVVSVAMGPDGQPWCTGIPAGHCPLFWTPLINRGAIADVQGLENAQAGATYDFVCSIHSAMTGTLVLAPEAS